MHGGAENSRSGEAQRRGGREVDRGLLPLCALRRAGERMREAPIDLSAPLRLPDALLLASVLPACALAAETDASDQLRRAVGLDGERRAEPGWSAPAVQARGATL